MSTISALGGTHSASESGPSKNQTLSPEAQQALGSATQVGVVNPTMLAEAVSQLPQEQRSGVAQELTQYLGTEDAKDFNQALTGSPTGGSKAGPQETEAQDNLLLDLTQMGLDLAGIVDPTPICDGLSGIISLARGDWVGAGISLASMLPYVGDLSKLGKLGKYADALKSAIDLAKTDKKFASALKPVLEKLKSTLDQIPLDSLPQGCRELVEGMKSKIDEFLEGAHHVDNVGGAASSGVSASFSSKQLDKKFKHAEDFGISTTKKNPETLKKYQEALQSHLNDPATFQHGTYQYVPDSVVHFNKNTNNVVVLNKGGEFVTGWKLSPGTPQFENFVKNGVLR